MSVIITELDKIKEVWRQKYIPVIFRKGKGNKLMLRLPFKEGNRKWLKNERRNEPSWLKDKKCWEIPMSWLNDTVDRTLERFGEVYIIQPYKESEKCAPACWNAQGHECNCSCMGHNHGAGYQGNYFVVTETFAVKWNELELACRLLKTKK